MINILPKIKKEVKLQKPQYKLTFYYMIGDADGEDKETTYLPIDEPNLEEFLVAMDKLKPKLGHWGLILDSELLDENLKRNIITEDEYNLIEIKMNSYEDIFRSYGDLGFYIWERYKLTYIDENGNKFKTEIINN